jgi:hypothetical protein
MHCARQISTARSPWCGPIMLLQRQCLTCRKGKPLEEFYPSKHGYLGRKSRCKACQSLYAKARHRWKWANDPAWRAKNIAKSIQWAKDHPEKRAVIAHNRNCKIRGTPQERCRRWIGKAVLRGKMVTAKLLSCVKCGKPAAHYHHHLGYEWEHRANVIALCVSCHTLAK